MKIRGKAQTATEYIIILAVVIIISLIVVGLIITSSNSGSRSPQNADIAFFATSSNIAVLDFFYNASGTASFTLKNHLNDDITVLNMSITVDGNQRVVSNTNRVLRTGLQTVASTYGLQPCSVGSQVVVEELQVCYRNEKTSGTFCEDYEGRSLAITCSLS